MFRVHLEFSTPVWSPWLKGDIDLLEKVQERVVKMISGLQGTTYEDKLKELKLMSLTDRRTRFDQIQIYKIVKGINKVSSETWFEPDIPRNTRGSHPLNLKVKFRNSDTAKNFFSVRAAKKWNSLPGHLKDSPTLTCFKSRYDKYVGQN